MTPLNGYYDHCKRQWVKFQPETETENDMHQDENLGTACEKLEKLVIENYVNLDDPCYDVNAHFVGLTYKELQAVQALLLTARGN